MVHYQLCLKYAVNRDISFSQLIIWIYENIAK